MLWCFIFKGERMGLIHSCMHGHDDGDMVRWFY